MCPICHVPLINPISLECDHCFCSTCFAKSCDRVSADEGPKCPSCRAPIRTMPRKAPRLILNMCDDIKVRCPNEGCDQILSRGHVEHHARKQCLEERLSCPRYPSCDKLTKRRLFVPEQCRHSTHVECDCGMEIEFGEGRMRKHKDEQCSNAGEKCKECSKRLPDDSYLSGTNHGCEASGQPCPGEEFGCGGYDNEEKMEDHIKRCMIAKLAPSLKAQASLLAEVKSELAWTKTRNEVLESSLDRMNEDRRNTVPLPAHEQDPPEDWFHSVGSPTALDGPSNDSDFLPNRDLALVSRRATDIESQPPADPTSQQHLLALHESLRTSFANLQGDVSSLSNNLAEVDARTSMHIMNETLRIKEDLAHTNAALFSTKAQVHWLLNRERAGQQMGVRGRAPGPSTASATASASSSQQINAVDAAPMARGPSSEGSGSEQTVESVLARRPTRRPSGGSQERVKL